MTPQAFIQTYYSHAYKCWQDTGIHPIATLTQAAIESGWGEHAPGNAFFGIKSTDTNEKRQLEVTTEVLTTPNAHFPEILKITPQGNGTWLYLCKDWFRAYDTAGEGFDDHARFFIQNSRYAAALTVKSDPYKFLAEVAKAHYATNPNYGHDLDITAHAINSISQHMNISPLVPIS